ncbi:hypothetical protein [Streptomyces sp. NPDC059459]|uniref:hypothetical protein n=1 Tax=unclassified Streptomyces TaxID=2593676 RepID=UPI0036D1BE33
MPRGRHRHSPPLHRLLPPSAIAGVSLVCALGPWVFSEAMILRSLAAAAAVTAVAGAVVMRHWDAQAGRRVADLTRARASDEWRYEERVAELESDLEESRELRVKLEHRLRAKRTELAGLRNEHASLLRRYATAETERASALEGRRLLEIEAVPPARALPAARTASAEEAPAGGAQAPAGGAQVEREAPAGGTPVGEGEEGGEAAEEAPAVFSPEGSRLFLRANAALARLDEDAPAAPAAADRDGEGDSEDGGGDDGDGGGNGGGERAAAAESAQADEAPGQPEAGGHERPAAASPSPQPGRPGQAQGPEEQTGERSERPEQSGDRGERSERSGEPSAQPKQATRQTSGHFTVPTAVAVVPTAPVRRPVIEGGFDFFGTKDAEDAEGVADAQDAEDGRAPSATLEAVQNEDLADVVGQEALALHKAEAEAAFKPAGEETRGVGQVIDLTAHDETEQIDVQGLRSAVS